MLTRLFYTAFWCAILPLVLLLWAVEGFCTAFGALVAFWADPDVFKHMDDLTNLLGVEDDKR